MTKLLRISTLAAAVALSTNVFAAADDPTFIGAGGTHTISNVNNCTALANDVTIQLSENVFAAYDCGPGSVVAGACSSTGTNKSQDFDCTYTSAVDPADSNLMVGIYPDGCAAWDPNTQNSPTGEVYTNTGRVAFVGSAGGGTVGVFGMGTAVCSGATMINTITN